MKYYSFFIAALLVGMSFSSCEDKDDELVNNNPSRPDDIQIPELTALANEFVYFIMDNYYLYNEGISDSKGYPVIDFYKEPDTKEYFEKLRNPKDIFSFITDDADAFRQEQGGISTSMGWDYSLMYGDSEKSTVVAAINYVYEGTPAARAGVKRGDYVFTVNGTVMTPQNYSSLWGKDGEYGLSRYDADRNETPLIVNLKSEQVSTSPVAEANIFQLNDGTKIGYLLYMDYYAAFNDELASVFSQFKDNGVSKLILDLRYNPGGQMEACSYLASLIAPENVVSEEKEIVHYKYNEILTKEFGKDETTFTKTALTNNLNLNSIVIIQGGDTYSASEATILGLKPYMDVYTIGYTSGGKNTAMYVITPDLIVHSKTDEPYFDSRINNWLIAPLVAQYYNSADETFDTTDGDGMEPDFMFNEYSELFREQLGEPTESLTALAIEYIANGSIANSKSSKLSLWGISIPATDYRKICPVQIPFNNKFISK